MNRRHQLRRRGVTTVQWVVLTVLIFLVVLAGVTSLGSRTSDKLDQTGQDLADPANLTKRF
jgi:hypothetical protein